MKVKEDIKMTRGEAIWYLNAQKESNEHKLFDFHFNEAIDMAIKTLDQEPSMAKITVEAKGKGH